MQSNPLLNRRIRVWTTVLIISLVLVVGGPFYGMLGTIFGMIRAFSVLKEGSTSGPEELSSNISIALETTGIGIVVAVIALVPFLISLVFVLRYRRQRQMLSTADATGS